MRLIFWMSLSACIFLSTAWIIAYNKFNDKSKEDPQELFEEDEMNQNMEGLMKLEIRRRMALTSGSISF